MKNSLHHRTITLLAVVSLITACGGGGGGGSSVASAPSTSGSTTPAVSTPPPVVPAVVPDAARELTADIRSPSVARQWNESLMEAIRNDFARPTVHARNLFHISAAMFDAWNSYNPGKESYLLGNTKNGFSCRFDGIPSSEDAVPDQEQAVSYAAFRLIEHRFRSSPGVTEILASISALMGELGFDPSNQSLDYSSGSAAALGNYIARCYIDYGLQDGSNEVNDYTNRAYRSINPVIEPDLPGNSNMVDLDRWQAISLEEFIDQAGNPVSAEPEFLGPEWGSVESFALEASDRIVRTRDGFDYSIYHDPGAPPSISSSRPENYQWHFSLVALWSSHLAVDPDVTLDISPASLGNNDIAALPRALDDHDTFYDFISGGDTSPGRDINPVTGQPYQPQVVPLGDYSRVLAEFWADGPDSETPPGHWFVILNQVMDHPQFTRQWMGAGEELGPLEWDVKAYFTLGGAMHDSAIAAWSVKGWYDFVRPLSAIRAMAELGQSSDPNLPSYHPQGLPLQPGYIELVPEGDALAGNNNEHVNKVKLFAWRGPDFVVDPTTDVAGVGWILAENWWPYQRPTFVTPPFAGYVSGHSTFSRAAAEVLTMITGDEYFPGGIGVFPIPANDFLVFEQGPSVDMRLEWATYRDASDQCSLSRIWGGIHPPADDLPGRFIGEQVGQQAVAAAVTMFAAADVVAPIPVTPDSTPVVPPVVTAEPPVSHVAFTRLTTAAGLSYVHGFTRYSPSTEAVAGVAVGDYDADGWLDLYIAQGDTGKNLLYRSLGQPGRYQFEEVAAIAQVDMTALDKTSGPAFVDYDGDGDLDLFVGGIEFNGIKLFKNRGDGTFEDATASSGLSNMTRENTVSFAFGDYDKDGDLDMFMAHWTFTIDELPDGSPQFLWQNNGDGTFTDVSDITGMSEAAISFGVDYTFTPNFVDYDNDGDLDMLLVADNNTTHVIKNEGDAGDGRYSFVRFTDERVITDQAGMGSAIADFDHDGDLDWFVTSIEEIGNRDRNGNRYYRNDGSGAFSEVTNEAGLRSGFWGWASCAADFNNDGHLDIFHVNGIGEEAGTQEFLFDPSRLFLGRGDGTFVESTETVGIVERRQGRGVVCFDGDKDGDIDIFIANNNDAPSLLQNNGGNTLNWLNLSLQAPSPNTGATGARIYMDTGAFTQMREVTQGNNYVSHNPLEQHFGLNSLGSVPSIRVVWPDGRQTQRFDVQANQRIVVTYPDSWSVDG
jgi:hypothetical protein